jgi:deazaflavin-dependent oxidoreductase (nitroreductase family)
MTDKKLRHDPVAAVPDTATGRDTPPPNAAPARQATAGGTAHTLRFQGLVNRIVRGLLRTPLLCRAVGNWLLTVYVTGRKSGRRYAVPTAYTRHGDSLLIGTQFGWARNFRTGEPVTIRFKGKRRPADVHLVTDEPGVVEAYALMARHNHGFAKFNKIGLDPSGNPDPTDLHRAWAAGARAVRLTPH